MAGHGSPPPEDRGDHPNRKVHHVNPGVSHGEHDAYASERFNRLYGQHAMSDRDFVTTFGMIGPTGKVRAPNATFGGPAGFGGVDPAYEAAHDYEDKEH